MGEGTESPRSTLLRFALELQAVVDLLAGRREHALEARAVLRLELHGRRQRERERQRGQVRTLAFDLRLRLADESGLEHDLVHAVRRPLRILVGEALDVQRLPARAVV